MRVLTATQSRRNNVSIGSIHRYVRGGMVVLPHVAAQLPLLCVWTDPP